MNRPNPARAFTARLAAAGVQTAEARGLYGHLTRLERRRRAGRISLAELLRRVDLLSAPLVTA